MGLMGGGEGGGRIGCVVKGETAEQARELVRYLLCTNEVMKMQRRMTLLLPMVAGGWILTGCAVDGNETSV